MVVLVIEELRSSCGRKVQAPGYPQEKPASCTFIGAEKNMNPQVPKALKWCPISLANSGGRFCFPTFVKSRESTSNPRATCYETPWFPWARGMATHDGPSGRQQVWLLRLREVTGRKLKGMVLKVKMVGMPW